MIITIITIIIIITITITIIIIINWPVSGRRPVSGPAAPSVGWLPPAQRAAPGAVGSPQATSLQPPQTSMPDRRQTVDTMKSINFLKLETALLDPHGWLKKKAFWMFLGYCLQELFQRAKHFQNKKQMTAWIQEMVIVPQSLKSRWCPSYLQVHLQGTLITVILSKSWFTMHAMHFKLHWKVIGIDHLQKMIFTQVLKWNAHYNVILNLPFQGKIYVIFYKPYFNNEKRAIKCSTRNVVYLGYFEFKLFFSNYI